MFVEGTRTVRGRVIVRGNVRRFFHQSQTRHPKFQDSPICGCVYSGKRMPLVVIVGSCVPYFQ